MHNQERCDHCRKWVSIKAETQLYTLYDLANGHPKSESVAICQRCCDKYSADYWEAWLNKRH